MAPDAWTGSYELVVQLNTGCDAYSSSQVQFGDAVHLSGADVANSLIPTRYLRKPITTTTTTTTMMMMMAATKLTTKLRTEAEHVNVTESITEYEHSVRKC